MAGELSLSLKTDSEKIGWVKTFLKKKKNREALQKEGVVEMKREIF